MKFQENRISLGEKEAEIQRELAELKLQFPGQDLTEIEDKIGKVISYKLDKEKRSKVIAYVDTPRHQLKTLMNEHEIKHIPISFQYNKNALNDLNKQSKYKYILLTSQHW